MKKVFCYTQKNRYLNANYGKSCFPVIILILIIGLIIASCSNNEEFKVVDYQINQGTDKFTVTGAIRLDGYDCDEVLLNAIAVDNKGQVIYLAEKFSINGDGVYAFELWGYYLDPGTSIAEVKDFIVRER